MSWGAGSGEGEPILKANIFKSHIPTYLQKKHPYYYQDKKKTRISNGFLDPVFNVTMKLKQSLLNFNCYSIC